ncbi:MAG: nuclease-related domain-containing protein [Hyphomicrobiales bacterium]
MGAGDSAREVARRTAAAASVLQRKADSAARKAVTFSEGADGEETLSQVLAPLAAKGWLALPDRQSPRGGNLDEIVVGPAGVAVIDAKKWSYRVTVKSDDIYTGRYRRSNALDGVIGQVEIVNASLAGIGFPVMVQGFIALVGELDRERDHELVRDVGIIGLDQIVDKFLKMKGQLTTVQVEDVFRALSLAFPPMVVASAKAVPAQHDPVKVRKLFDKNARFFYIHQWNKSGKSRLYLRASDGSDLGWKNVHTGQVQVTCDGDDAKLVRAVLDSASPTGVTLAAENLPKIALDFPGGKFLARLGPLWAPVLIGQEWKSKGVHRLYGTLIYSGDGSYSLGYADLDTGRLHPAVDGKLGKDYAPAVKYLQLLTERRPRVERGHTT